MRSTQFRQAGHRFRIKLGDQRLPLNLLLIFAIYNIIIRFKYFYIKIAMAATIQFA